ncbi:MAG: hypothetical protein WC043_10795 [Pseudobdellovibrionaceae bacterium]
MGARTSKLDTLAYVASGQQLKRKNILVSEIEREYLPPLKMEEPKIPGTNIPDRGVPEAYVPPEPPEWRKNNIIDPMEIIVPPVDEDIMLPYSKDDPNLFMRTRKTRSL